LKTLTAILIDLDGTLTDPAPGIIGSCRYALQRLGQDVPEPESLGWIIGPPLRDSFARLLTGSATPEAALALYRERYRAGGMLEATLYAGIVPMLESLHRITPRLILCTSKPHVFARPILAHFGLAPFFTAVYGAELDGRHDDKGDLIAHLLEEESIDPAHACMIGDRLFDVRGAGRHGIPTIGALWGYGGEAELREAGAVSLCATPSDVPVAILNLCAA
jgi:phosphoglycolate phosphatase